MGSGWFGTETNEDVKKDKKRKKDAEDRLRAAGKEKVSGNGLLGRKFDDAAIEDLKKRR